MIIGTAGHVDHGKTTLVKALTGVDTDRLQEEKRRGITIDLGFAYLRGAADRVLSFVDVPGHERFVHRMLTGAHGIDFVLLTVAANEGVMPQTREHLEILDLLGLRRGLVVLTKADLVDADTLLARHLEVIEALEGSTLAAAEVLAVSATTGEGLDALLARLWAEAAVTPPRPDERPFRLAIDRSFALAGVGTVVTGTVLDGRVQVGNRLAVTPNGPMVRARAIHVRNASAALARAGDRAAINLTGPGVGTDTVRRGEMLLLADHDHVTPRIDVALRLTVDRLPAGARVRLFHATAEVGAHVVPLRAEGRTDAQLVLERPIAARWGDRIILRDVSHTTTLAGGRVLDADPPRRHRATEARARLRAAWDQAHAADLLPALLAQPPHVVDLTAFRRTTGLLEQVEQAALQAQAIEVVMTPDGPWAVRAQDLADWAGPWRDRLAAHHKEQPSEPGLAVARLRSLAVVSAPLPVFQGMLAMTPGITVDGMLVRLTGHATHHDPRQAAIWARVLPLLSGDNRFRPPRGRDIAQALAENERLIREALRGARRLGLLLELGPDLHVLRTALAEMVGIARQLEADTADGWFTAAAFRDRLGNGRRVAIQILEYLDRRGVTVRRGDLRRIDQRRAGLFDAPDGPVS